MATSNPTGCSCTSYCRCGLRKSDVVKVQTAQRLYRGATIELAPNIFRKVIRVDASISQGRDFVTVVEVEPTIISVGEYTYDAIVV